MKDKTIALLQERFGVEKTSRLLAYMRGILDKNEQLNLTAVREEAEFLEKHILDSLTILDAEKFRAAKTVVDMGTGAGFPGVPLAIVAPEKKFVLVDSLQKRLNVIRELIAALGVDNVEVLHLRAEDMGQDPKYRERFDLCVSRAVANLTVLAEWCLPLVRVGGTMIAYKGEKAAEELEEARTAVRVLGGGPARTETQRTEGKLISGHILLYLKKVHKTPKLYPRKPGQAKKTPIR